jgi:hypothetical protein
MRPRPGYAALTTGSKQKEIIVAYLLGMVVAFAVNFGPCRRGEISLAKRNLITLLWPIYGLGGIIGMLSTLVLRFRRPASAANL